MWVELSEGYSWTFGLHSSAWKDWSLPPLLCHSLQSTLSPFVLYSELSLLSCATPLHKITTISPFCPSPGTPPPFPFLFLSVTLFYTHRPNSNDPKVSQGWISRTTSYLFHFAPGCVLHTRTHSQTQTHSTAQHSVFTPTIFPLIPPTAKKKKKFVFTRALHAPWIHHIRRKKKTSWCKASVHWCIANSCMSS